MDLKGSFFSPQINRVWTSNNVFLFFLRSDQINLTIWSSFPDFHSHRVHCLKWHIYLYHESFNLYGKCRWIYHFHPFPPTDPVHGIESLPRNHEEKELRQGRVISLSRNVRNSESGSGTGGFCTSPRCFDFEFFGCGVFCAMKNLNGTKSQRTPFP